MAVPPWEVERGESTCPGARHASQAVAAASGQGGVRCGRPHVGRVACGTAALTFLAPSGVDMQASDHESGGSRGCRSTASSFDVEVTEEAGVKYMMLIYLDEAWARLTT